MILYPHCKINLGLQVTSRREDGYHEISSLLYPIFGLTDMLEIVEGDRFDFSSSGIAIDCSTENNLCYRAYQLLKRDFDIPPVKIHLHKVVPMGAGLGGGSSDATFTLKTLNELFDLKLSIEQLKEYSLLLGSDTPFFLYDGAMEVSGRGDRLSQNSLSLKGWHITIVKPNIHVSTKEAFAGITPHPLQRSISDIISEDISVWQDNLGNDFETTIFKNHPKLSEIKGSLIDLGAIYAAMSGSGSAIFGISKDKINIDIDNDTFIYSGIL